MTRLNQEVNVGDYITVQRSDGVEAYGRVIRRGKGCFLLVVDVDGEEEVLDELKGDRWTMHHRALPYRRSI